MKETRLRKSLKISLVEGGFAACMTGLTENFWVPCAEALGVSTLKAGMMITTANLSGSLVQIASDKIARGLKSRLKVVKIFVSFQWLVLFSLISLPFLPEAWRFKALAAAAILFTVGGAIPGPAWLSLMSDHLPVTSRGKYFGWRNRILTFLAFSAGMFAGWTLNLFSGNVLIGFATIFGIAGLVRLVSWSLVIRMHEPRMKKGVASETVPESFVDFLRSGDQSHFVRLAFFVALFQFSVNLVAPYLAIYMLRELHFSYLTFTYVTFTATFAALIGVKIWGELADRFGNLKVIKSTTAFISIVSFLWFFAGGNPWIIGGIQFAAGFAWSGFQLCILIFAISDLPAHMRTRASAYLAALNGIAIFAGSLTGGLLLKILPAVQGSHFMTLFLVSSTCRMLTVLYFHKKLTQNRPAEPISSVNLFFEAVATNPLVQTGREFLGQITPRNAGKMFLIASICAVFSAATLHSAEKKKSILKKTGQAIETGGKRVVYGVTNAIEGMATTISEPILNPKKAVSRWFDFDPALETGERKNFNVLPLFVSSPERGVGFGIKFAMESILRKSDVVNLQAIHTAKNKSSYRLKYALPPELLWQAGGEIETGYENYTRFYYGIGNRARKEDESQYDAEIFDARLPLLFGLGPRFSVGLILGFENWALTRVSPEGVLNRDMPLLTGRNGTQFQTTGALLRWDSRNVKSNPSRGFLVEVSKEYSTELKGREQEFRRTAAEIRAFHPLYWDDHIFGARLSMDYKQGDVPFYKLPELGGIFYTRGLFEGRYRDTLALTANGEYRFRIYQRLHWAFFVDVGNVYSEFNKVTPRYTKVTGGTGMRYYVPPGNLLLARIDAGYSVEGLNIYLTFDHPF